MKDSTRRLVLFIVILVAGSLMIVLDIPVFYLILGTVCLGIILLFLTGAVRLPSFRREGKKQKGPSPPAPEKKAKKIPKKRKERIQGEKGGIGEFFSSLAGAFSALGRDLKNLGRSDQEKERRRKKLDELLDASVRGAEVVSLDDIAPDAVPVEKKKVSDPFTALVSEDLNADLVNGVPGEDEYSFLEDMEIDVGNGPAPGEATAVNNAAMDIGLSTEEIPVALDEVNDADEVKEILAAHEEELALPGDAELAGLENLDLDAVDVGGEPAPGPVAEPAQPPAPAPSPAEAPGAAAPPPQPGEAEMATFARARGETDDLMAALKAEARGVKKQEYASLIRDLKDVHIPAADLEKELADLLKTRKRSGGQQSQ